MGHIACVPRHELHSASLVLRHFQGVWGFDVSYRRLVPEVPSVPWFLREFVGFCGHNAALRIFFDYTSNLGTRILI